MSAQAINRPITYDDLAASPEDGKRYELIAGEVFVAASPQEPHQSTSFELTLAAGGHVKEARLGRVYVAPFDVKFSDHDVVQPDLLYVARARVGIIERRCVAGAPDLVVEILSPSNRAWDLVVKAQLYARYGVPEYWQVDTDDRTVAVFTLVGGRYRSVPRGEDGRPRSLVLPDLLLDEAPLFLDVG